MSFSGKPGHLPLVLRGEGAAGVTALQNALGNALAKAGLGARQSAPHLTLLYDARRIDEQPIEPIDWTVREFVLVHSLLGQDELYSAWQMAAARLIWRGTGKTLNAHHLRHQELRHDEEGARLARHARRDIRLP